MKNEEIINQIKNFLSKYNAVVKVCQEDNKVKVDLEEPIRISEEEYENEFYGFLREIEFMSSDIWENRIVNNFEYRSYEGCEQYENFNSDKILCIYYTKISKQGKTTYFIKRILLEDIE